MTEPAPLAISLGDPAGVGPELLAEAWSRRESEALNPLFLVGGAGVVSAAARRRGLVVPVERIESPAEAARVFGRALPVLGTADGEYRPGEPTREGAELAVDSLSQATGLALSGDACGIVTGPVAKSQLVGIGFTQAGQTEFLADACGMAHDNAVMMLAGPSLRTVPLTVHIPLAEVPARISSDLVEARARIVVRALRRDFGLEQPRLAIAGLNPHAGEDGRFGDEEQRILGPAVSRLRDEGIDVTGPHPADALFAPHAREHYDVAICMYHDQALIPIKALDFDVGVNVTLGLPIIRTSADHGTAFAIAGKNTARPGATIAAIRMASECAVRRAAA